MLQSTQVQNKPSRARLKVQLAHHADEVEAAQALRYRIFAEEMGAKLNTPVAGLDIDLFDRHCDHLLVRDEDTGEVVGCYRILPPDNARKVGSFYSDTEFDLTRLSLLRERMAEVGRSCVHADYRSGAVITLLWAGLADYMTQRGHDYLIGCASVGMADGGHMAASLYEKLAPDYLAPPEWRVSPRCALPLADLDRTQTVSVPPLVKGYLRAGAFIGGAPAWDPDFNTADFFILLPMSRLSARYSKHFLRSE